MKFIQKISLILFVLIAGIYAASPWWLSFVIARQLPPGWQLEKFEAAYPGFRGINIKRLRMNGKIWSVEMNLAAADIQFTYQGLKTDIGSLSLDAYLQANEGGTADITADDLTLPITKLTGKFPELSVNQLQVVLYNAINSGPNNIAGDKPLVLDFQAVKLAPRADNNFHLTANVSIRDSPGIHGQLGVDTGPESLEASFRFPADTGSPPWLLVSFEQKYVGPRTTTHIRAALDTEHVDQEWLDTILMRGTGSLITHMNGKLLLEVDFEGSEEPQNVRQLSLTVEQLRTELVGGTLVLNAAHVSIAAELAARNGRLFSTGEAIFIDARIEPMSASAAKVDTSWQDLDLFSMVGKMSTHTQGFATEYEGETWTGFDFDVTYNLLGNTDVSGAGNITFNSSLEFPIEFAGNIQAGKWGITLPATQIQMAQLAGLLEVANFELPASIKLTDGYIDLQGSIAVDDEITATMAINGHEMAASMLESSVRKAGFSFDTTYGRTISASGPLSIEAVTLAGGVAVTHILADLKLESTESFGIQNLYAEVFDGQLNLENLRFSDSRLEDTTIELSHINLGHLLAFADIDGLEGTGFLEISLPAGSDESGVYIKNGIFHSAGPGRLAYTQAGVANSNIGMQALANFQYKDFSGTIDYQSDGAYQISIRLEGRNPELYDGYPIVFKLNISGSLPKLFEALFMTGDFEESILKRIGIE